jgi:hypothetical protein
MHVLPVVGAVWRRSSSDSVRSSRFTTPGGATLGYRSEGEGDTTRECCGFVEPAALS